MLAALCCGLALREKLMRILRPECSECFVEQSRVLLFFLAKAEVHPKSACLLDTYESHQTKQDMELGQGPPHD